MCYYVNLFLLDYARSLAAIQKRTELNYICVIKNIRLQSDTLEKIDVAFKRLLGHHQKPSQICKKRGSC